MLHKEFHYVNSMRLSQMRDKRRSKKANEIHAASDSNNIKLLHDLLGGVYGPMYSMMSPF